MNKKSFQLKNSYLFKLDEAHHPFLLHSWMRLAWYEQFGKFHDEVLS